MMNDRNDFNHDDLLDRAVQAVLRGPVPDEPSPAKLAELIAQVRHAADQPQPIRLIERIKNMKPMTRITVAATVLIAFAGLMSWLAPHGGTSTAFAAVAEALNAVQSATWKTETTVKGPDGMPITTSWKNMFLAPSHERLEIAADGGKPAGATIIDGKKDKMITLLPDTKTAFVVNFKNLPKQNPMGRTFQGLRELVANAQSGKGGKVERLGEKTVDGRRAEGFHIQLGAIDVKLWADPRTLLPIRIEQTTSETRVVMTNFQTGMNLEPSLFSIDVPAGYTVPNTAQLDFSKKPINYVADALKIAAGYNGGVFPQELRGEHGIDGIVFRGERELKKKNPAAQMKLAAIMELSSKLGGAFGVLYSLRPENDWHYAGKDVKLGTPNRPIFWYKPKKDGDYVVLYADLSVKEVAAKDVPNAPKVDDRNIP
jgi:outer membrane lipoprotein-sorting protein